MTKRRTPGRTRQQSQPLYSGYDSEGSSAISERLSIIGGDYIEVPDRYPDDRRSQNTFDETFETTERKYRWKLEMVKPENTMERMMQLFMQMRKEDRDDRKQEREERSREERQREDK